MPVTPQFIPKFVEKRGWEVNIPKAFSKTGKRSREYFEEEKHAEAFAKKLRGQFARGERTPGLPLELTIDAREAAKILEGTGITLTAAAKMALEAHLVAGTSETLLARYEKALLDGETRWRRPYLRDMEKLPRWVSADYMQRQCSTITPAGTKQELASRGTFKQSTIDQRARYISAIVNWKPRHRKGTKIVILTPEAVETFMDACPTPEARRAAALLLFAGIRPSVDDGEITKLEWGAVLKKEIYISPEVSKTGTDRHIKITPRLARELKGHPSSGAVLPPGWTDIYPALRKAAGISANDVTRHTFASNFLAAFGEKAAKDAMGHTAGSQTLFRHYRASVTETGGRAYFK